MKKPRAINSAAKSIFIIDDAAWHNLILKTMLIDCGYDVDVFTEGHALLKMLETKTPQLIISDINMPDLDGFELHNKIKTQPWGENIPFLYISSLTLDAVKEQIKGSGAIGFFQKPLSKKSFLDMVARKL